MSSDWCLENTTYCDKTNYHHHHYVTMYQTLIMMLMPRLRKGFEKSMTLSRSAVIVRGAIAR